MEQNSLVSVYRTLPDGNREFIGCQYGSGKWVEDTIERGCLMYRIVMSKEEESLTLTTESKQLARSVAKVAKESEVNCEVYYEPEPRKVEFEV